MNYLIYKNRALNFAFMKPKFNMIYNAYSNESPFKYYVKGGIKIENQENYGLFPQFVTFFLSMLLLYNT